MGRKIEVPHEIDIKTFIRTQMQPDEMCLLTRPITANLLQDIWTIPEEIGLIRSPIETTLLKGTRDQILLADSSPANENIMAHTHKRSPYPSSKDLTNIHQYIFSELNIKAIIFEGGVTTWGNIDLHTTISLTQGLPNYLDNPTGYLQRCSRFGLEFNQISYDEFVSCFND